MDNALHLIGIARRAGRLEVGEEPVGAAARAGQASSPCSSSMKKLPV